MARGNIYILIHEDDLNELPPLKTRQRYQYDEAGVTITPTWAQLGEHYQNRFGVVRNNIYIGDGERYYVFEFITSFVKGELNQLLSVGNPGNFPNGAILAADEAAVFLGDGSIAT